MTYEIYNEKGELERTALEDFFEFTEYLSGAKKVEVVIDCINKEFGDIICGYFYGKIKDREIYLDESDGFISLVIPKKLYDKIKLDSTFDYLLDKYGYRLIDLQFKNDSGDSVYLLGGHK